MGHLRQIDVPAVHQECDVLVIGGGPAGATIAALLAEGGRRVTLVEKDRHPRFHIGESLLPHNLPLLDRLGVRAAVEACSMPKHGIEFVSPFHGKSVKYEFAKSWDKHLPYAFQVRRSSFDEILFKNAAAKGAAVIEGCRITAVDFDGAKPVVTGRDEDGIERKWTAGFVVDASGRDTMLAGQMNMKQRNPKNDSAAMFGHFTNARRLPGREEGNISIIWFDHGWFWFIPLADGSTSVGAVCPAAFFKQRGGADLTSFFMRAIASSPELSNRLAGATLAGAVTATGNYSYDAARTSGGNFLLVGDACGFIDPVFSAGVYLAMVTAFRAAETVETCLSTPAAAGGALRRYDTATRKMLRSFTWFVYRVREPAMRNLLMSPRNWFRVEEAVLSLLSGGIFYGWQIRSRLYLFRSFYYITKATHLRFRLTKPRQAAGVVAAE